MKTGYIINKFNEVIATVDVDDSVKSGSVEYAYDKTFDAIRQVNALVNRRSGKISFAKKWATKQIEGFAKVVDNGYLIK